MIDIGNKNDWEIFAKLKEFFELYEREAEKGRYFKFLPEDFLSDKISLESRETADSVEAGLRYLGKAAYFTATGFWEHNDWSIKIDGYPPIDSIMWPILKILLSRKESPSFEKVGKKIKEPEAGTKKTEEDVSKKGAENEIHGSNEGDGEKIRILMNGKEICSDNRKKSEAQAKSLEDILLDARCLIESCTDRKLNPNKREMGIGDVLVFPLYGRKIFVSYSGNKEEILIGKSEKECERYSLKEYNYEIWDQDQGKWVHLRLRQGLRSSPEAKTGGRDAEKFLDEVIKFVRENTGILDSGIEYPDAWFINKDKTVIEIIPKHIKSIALFEKNGFTDKMETAEIIMDWNESQGYGDIPHFYSAMEELKTTLKGKKILSVLDKSGNWYLKVL